MSHKEDEIVQKVEYILNYSTEIKQDIALQQFLNFNFTNEFKNKILTLPVKKSEKESFKFIEQYVSLVYSLFKLKKEERITLYSSPIPLTKDYNNISQNINQLNKIIEDKKEYIYDNYNIYWSFQELIPPHEFILVIAQKTEAEILKASYDKRISELESKVNGNKLVSQN